MDISDKGGKVASNKSKGVDPKVTMIGDGESLGKLQCKRTHSEVSEASIEELGFIHEQMDTLTTDLKETKESMKNLMTKDDIEGFITKTVESVLIGMEAKIKKMVEEEVKDKMTVHLTELNDRLDNMVFENGDTKDRLDKVEDQLKKENERTKSALERSNYNEQFSRKKNVKILEVEVLEDEVEVKLMQ